MSRASWKSSALSLALVVGAGCATWRASAGPPWSGPEYIGDCDTGWEPLRTRRGRLLAWLDEHARDTGGVTVFFEGALAYGDYAPRYQYALVMGGVAVRGLLEGTERREPVTSPELLELLRKIGAGELVPEDSIEDWASDRYDAHLTIRARGEVRRIHVQTASWAATSPAVRLLLGLMKYEDSLKDGPEGLRPMDEPGTGRIICR